MYEKNLFICRGLPSSGKTYAANKLRKFLQVNNSDCFIFSTDDHWLDENGVYNFQPQYLAKAHRWNRDRVATAMEKHVRNIVVDNTNTTLKEMKAYIDLARNNGYGVTLVYPNTSWAWNVQECAKRNSHGVPLETIQKMFDRFEGHATIEGKLGEVNYLGIK